MFGMLKNCVTIGPITTSLDQLPLLPLPPLTTNRITTFLEFISLHHSTTHQYQIVLQPSTTYTSVQYYNSTTTKPDPPTFGLLFCEVILHLGHANTVNLADTRFSSFNEALDLMNSSLRIPLLKWLATDLSQHHHHGTLPMRTRWHTTL